MADAAPRPSFSQRLREMAIGGMGGSTTPTPTATPTPTPVTNEPPVPSRGRITAELADIITGGFLGLTQNRLDDERNRHLQELEQARQNRDIAREQKVADNAIAEIAKPVRAPRKRRVTAASESLASNGIGLNPIEPVIEAKPKKPRKTSTKAGSSSPKRSTQAMELAKIAAAQSETNTQLSNIDDKLSAIHLVMNEIKIGIFKMNTKPMIGSGGIPSSSWFANGIPGIDPRPQNSGGTSIAGIAPIPSGGGGNTPAGRPGGAAARVPPAVPRTPLARFGPAGAIAGIAIVGGLIAEHLIGRRDSANSTPEPSTPEERRSPETNGDTPQQTQALQEITRARTDGLITDVQATALRRQVTSGNPQEVIDHLAQLRRNRPPTPAPTTTPPAAAPVPTPPAGSTTPRPGNSDIRERNRNIAQERTRILDDDSLTETQREAALRALSMRHFQEHTGTNPTSTFRNTADWYTPNTTPQVARPNTPATGPRVLATANSTPITAPSTTPTATPIPMSANITVGGLKPDATAPSNKIETNMAPVATGAGTSPTGPTVNAERPAGEPGQEIERRRRTDEEFITEFTPLAEIVSNRIGVPARTILAHWSLETNNGRAFSGRNNLGNMTGTSRERTTAGGDTDGAGRQITQRFLDFDTPEAFAERYASWVERRAPGARNLTDPREFGQALRNASYATAPHFANAVHGVANRPAFASMGTALPTTPAANGTPTTATANNAPAATQPRTASNVPVTTITPRTATNIPVPPPPAPPVPVEPDTTRIRESGMPMASLDGSFNPVERNNPDAPYHTLTDFAVNDAGPRIVMASNDDQRPNEPPRTGDLPTGTHVNPYQVPSVRPDTHALQVLFGYPLA